ncbi:MAG: MAPEG family protein [Hyphomicrobiales bacterium]
MTLKLFLAAVIAQFIMTAGLGAATAWLRVNAARRGQVKLKDVALDNDAWPSRVRQITNAFNNQFEVPLVFLGFASLAVATQTVDTVMVVLAWLFVASRVVHMLIHTGGNNVLHRFLAFITGFTFLVLLWAWFALRIYVAG